MGPVTNLPSSEENALLIFDFDQTITNQSMCNFFTSKGYDDYDSGKEKAVIKEKIEEFLQKEGSGIKNKEKLRSVLDSALSSGVEVAIVSSAKYIKAVEYVVKNHLGLTEEHAQGIKVVGGTTKRQDPLNSAEVAKRMNEPQDPQIGKHLCVLSLLKAYKKDKGMLPQKVMLVDGNQRNIDPVGDFRRNVKELLEKDMVSLLENIDQETAKVDIKEEEINNIAFKGINVSSELTTGTDGAADDGYLGKVEKWIGEPIQNLENPVDDGPGNHIYATINPDTKSSKKSLNNRIGGQNSKDDLGTSSTTLPSYKSKDDSEESLSLNSDIGSTTNKRTNRIWPRVKYTMQQKGFIIPATSFFLITTYLSSSCLYRLLYLKETINFIDYIKSFQIWPLVTISSGLAVIGLCAFIYNYRNTESPDVYGLDNLSNVVSNNNLVHDITIYKKNNDLVKFKNKSYAGHRNIPNFTYKKSKLVKERALFNICFSSFITIGSIYPLIKYLELGSEGFIKFFRFSSGKEELMISKLLVSENDAKLLSYFNNHNLKLIAFAAVLTVLAASLVCIFAYYRNEKTHIEPLKFDILVDDSIKARNDRYLEEVKGKCKEISTEIETVVVRHYNDVDEEKKITVLAL